MPANARCQPSVDFMSGGQAATDPLNFELPAGIAAQLDPSLPRIFRPNQFWKAAFYQAVRRAARELEIGISGVHRLRANYAQQVHKDLIKHGKSDREARLEVSRRLGHNRVEVTSSYIPPGIHRTISRKTDDKK